MGINKIKICVLCKKEIKKKDNYCRITDYKNGEFFCENYYHTLCYNNQVKGVNPDQKQMKQAALLTLDKLNQVLERGGGIKKEYEVK